MVARSGVERSRDYWIFLDGYIFLAMGLCSRARVELSYNGFIIINTKFFYVRDWFKDGRCICNDISVPSYDTSVATVLETQEHANKAD